MGLYLCKENCEKCYNPNNTVNLTQQPFDNPFFHNTGESIVVRDPEKDIFKFNENNTDNKENKNDEKERYDKLKKQILEKQKDDRKNIPDKKVINSKIINESIKERATNEKINQLLEDMCIYGSITKNEIENEKKKNPEKFIETSQALKLEQQDQNLFALGLLSNNLEQLGIKTAIEKDEGNEDKQDAGTTCLQFIVNGLAQKKKYDLHFELGNERNEQLLNDPNEYEKFKNDIKKKLSKDYHIPEDKIIVAFPQKGSFRVQVIFQSNEFNDLDTKELEQKFKDDDEFPELSKLKIIQSDVIMGGCKLSKNQLDPLGNRSEGWAENEERGGKPYYPPIGWTAFGLNIKNKYDNGDTTWMGHSNSKNEWCIAYHPTSIKFAKSIILNGLQPGHSQFYEDYEDENHKNGKVGKGVYLYPKIKDAENHLKFDDEYLCIFMCRVNTQNLKIPKDSDILIYVAEAKDLRPYRICLKKG